MWTRHWVMSLKPLLWQDTSWKENVLWSASVEHRWDSFSIVCLKLTDYLKIWTRCMKNDSSLCCKNYLECYRLTKSNMILRWHVTLLTHLHSKVIYFSVVKFSWNKNVLLYNLMISYTWCLMSCCLIFWLWHCTVTLLLDPPKVTKGKICGKILYIEHFS